jgi:glycosyltransferase involved in cell wall biosynthesis
LESIATQTLDRFQTIFIDDGSTDDSRAILERFSSYSPPERPVKILLNSHLGLCESLNTTILQAVDTEFVARLDQDDLAVPERLQRQLGFLQSNPHYSMCLSQFSRIGSSGMNFGAYDLGPNPIINYSTEKHGCLPHSTLMFRREAFLKIGGYRKEFYPADDWDFLLRASESVNIAIINEVLVRFRVHNGSNTFRYFKQMDKMSRRAKALHKARLSGIPLEASAHDSYSVGLIRHWRQIKLRGKYHFRMAGAQVGSGRWLLGIFHLILGIVFHPIFAVNRLIRLLVFRVIKR